MNKSPLLVLMAGLTFACTASHKAHAFDARYPDWPCQQLKVPKIALVSIWSGPSLEGVPEQPTDPKVASLVARLAARRTPIEDARKLIDAFIVGTAAEKQEKAKILFAALFSALNAQRDQVMNGIERFSRKQKAFAQDIRTQVTKLREMQDAGNADPAGIDELSKRIEWETRIFEDRNRSTTYVCEVPVTIEKRLFDLSKAIRQATQ